MGMVLYVFAILFLLVVAMLAFSFLLACISSTSKNLTKEEWKLGMRQK